MRTNLSLAVAAGVLACLPLTSTAQKSEPPKPGGAYYSAQKPWHPPMPYNPFPDLPLIEVEPKRYVYDDTEVDYEAMQIQSLAMTMNAPPVPGPGGEGGTNIPPYLPPTVPIPGVPLLAIETLDGAHIASFNTIVGLIYRLEQTTNVTDPLWGTVQEFVATETNASFVIEGGETGFYRVFQDDDTIQFPDWFENIYQFMEFTVYTPVTSGTLAWELYADGGLVGSNSGPIPASGTVRVYDQNYNPADWPNTGYYGVAEWEFRVTVTPSPPPGQAATGGTHKIVNKKGVQRNPFGTYVGMLAAQGDIFSRVGPAQDEVDMANWFCMAAMYNACEIVNWGFTYVDVASTDSSHMTPHANIYNTNHWNPLRQWVARQTPSNTLSQQQLDYFHYMGHGSPKAIGSAGNFITLKYLQGSPFLQTNFLTYVALDGCRTSKSKDLLKALTGQGAKRSRFQFAAKGEDPHFGCGWNNVKVVEWVLQGVKNDNHFYFWEDFYYRLTQRNGQGLMFFNYTEAYNFAKNPAGQGVNNVLQTNPEANGFEYVGCEDCRFDERPGIVQ